jgi:amidophosphoribosyltransferase
MCGLIGITGKENVAELLYHGLIHLQHRGQDAAGIFAYNPKTGIHCLHKERGLVPQVFNSETLPLPDATWGIGHVRYSTIGTGKVEDTHPLSIDKKQTIVLAHNGNIVNYVPLKEMLEKQGITFKTTCDAEAVLNLIAKELPEKSPSFDDLCNAVRTVFDECSGSYSIVGMMTEMGMFAFRDPWGLRPLLYGTSHNGNAHAIASESGPLEFLGFEDIHDVKPGELVFIDMKNQMHRKVLVEAEHSHCSFEYNYFAKPNAILDEREVYRIRSNLGIALAEKVREANIDIDVVVPIPDTSRPSAISLAYKLNIPLEEGFVKQNHIGRTFIMPTQYARKKALSQKLVTVSSVFKDKNVMLVDDSIVRGTVSKRVIDLARKAGAKKIYFASTYPPIRYPCVYGIDFPRNDQLVAHGKTVEEIAEEIGADGLIYNDVEGLKAAIGLTTLCTACLTGTYPTGTQGVEQLQNLRNDDIINMELACTTL